MTTIAAPLLAAGAVAMLGVVAADSDEFRWPGPALLFLALSVISLVACVQWGFRARPFLYSMSEVEEWHRGVELTKVERNRLSQQRVDDLVRWRRGTGLAAFCYTSGLVTLGIGMALVLAPPVGDEFADWRWAVFGLVSLATSVEMLWSLLEWGDLVSRAVEQRLRLRRARARTGEDGPDDG
ncbi:hypothetical protein [Streptomyces sp. NPDC053079]|uniref:hypothetical protein n=1 Tax=Streptomyces sp. NPDC053079 TaxID=3365697 RepID=UPI0037CE82A0